MLNLSDADWVPTLVGFFNGELRSKAFRSLNPMGEWPVLEHQGRVLTQPDVILEYLTDKLGKFGPTDKDERLEIL